MCCFSHTLALLECGRSGETKEEKMDVTELAMMLNTIQLDPADPKEFQQAALTAKMFMNQIDQEQLWIVQAIDFEW